jgi:hypothetical protein
MSSATAPRQEGSTDAVTQHIALQPRSCQWKTLSQAREETTLVMDDSNFSTKLGSVAVPDKGMSRHNPYGVSNEPHVRCRTLDQHLLAVCNGRWSTLPWEKAHLPDFSTIPEHAQGTPNVDFRTIAVGQVPHEVDAGVLAAFLSMMSGVAILGARPHITGRGTRTGMNFVDVEPQHYDCLLQWHRRVLFLPDRVIITLDGDAQTALVEWLWRRDVWVDELATQMGRPFTPRGLLAMSVEPSNPRREPAHGGGDHGPRPKTRK